MCRTAGGEDVQGTARWRAPHTPSRFLSFFDETACGKHAVSFSPFFVDGAVCTLHAASFSFVHSPRRRAFREINEAACIPHAASLFFFCAFMFISPPVQGILFFRSGIVNGGWCMTHPSPSPFVSPHLLGVFFSALVSVARGRRATHPPCPPLFFPPQEQGGIFLQWLSTQGQHITNMLSLMILSPPIYLAKANVLINFKICNIYIK